MKVSIASYIKILAKDVKEEFKAPCRKAYARVVKDMKFLCKWHDTNALFKALKKDVKG